MRYIPTIGLEVHVQLRTDSKIFCTCANSYGKDQNSVVCPVCLGMPGVLPVLNKKVVELAIKTAVALNCTVYPLSIFARKNYFYPDLPKGYQISQYEEPLALSGSVDIPVNGSWKTIRVTRIHLEEDAGKSVHPEGKKEVKETRIDINRCGIPLMEIVSEPDLASPAEAFQYLTRLKQILLYLGVSDCNMEEGSLRCDANVSVRPETTETLGVKTELKNLNSFRYVEKALAFEISRQISLIEDGETIKQESLSWDSANDTTVLMRSKEESDDYRYFPEPDLIPLVISDDWIGEIKKSIPELPRAKKERFVRDYVLSEQNAEVLTATRELANYFEKTAKHCEDRKKAGNWILSEVLMVLKDKKISIEEFSVPPEDIGILVTMINAGTISGKIAKEVFADMVETGKNPAEIVESKGLEQVSDTGSLDKAIETVIDENPNEIAAYENGKEKLFGFFVGQVMKMTGGKANPAMVNKLLKEKLQQLAT